MLALAAICELLQALYSVKISGVNAAPVGLLPKLGGNESLIPMKNGCDASATGPPVTIPVARKLVAYLMAVDRRKQGFSKTVAKVDEKQAA